MSKKSSDEELEKIHQILDNSLPKSSEKKHDQYLSSLKRRVGHAQISTSSAKSHSEDSKSDLSPRVVIRRRKESLQVQETPSKREQNEEYTVKLVPSSGVAVSDDELFEVEKPFEEIPEFIEVTPEQESDEDAEPLTVKISSETNKEAESLPQWKVIEDQQEEVKKQPEIKDTEKEETFLERKPKKDTEMEKSVDEEQKPSFTKRGGKKTGIWEPLDVKKEKMSSSKTNHFKKVKDKKENETSSSTDLKEKITSSSKNDTFQYNDYKLYKKTIIINDEEKRTIHFFAKEPPELGEPTDLPEGYEVKINRKTGVPYIRKKQK